MYPILGSQSMKSRMFSSESAPSIQTPRWRREAVFFSVIESAASPDSGSMISYFLPGRRKWQPADWSQAYTPISTLHGLFPAITPPCSPVSITYPSGAIADCSVS